MRTELYRNRDRGFTVVSHTDSWTERHRHHISFPSWVVFCLCCCFVGKLQAPGSGGFAGCVRDLTLNEARAGTPTHSQGTVPCFQSPLQPGAYFSGQGGHMAIGIYMQSSSVFIHGASRLGHDVFWFKAPFFGPADEALVLGRDLEIQLEVRPVLDSGLLFHAGTSPDQRLSLVLKQGEVRDSWRLLVSNCHGN